MAIEINDQLAIADEEIELHAIRSQGSGGQNVNKVSTAIHLRFDIGSSSLPQKLKQRLKRLPDSRVSSSGTIVIKAQQFRSQEKNRDEAIARLREMVLDAMKSRKRRIPTKPTFGSRQKRLKSKTIRGKLKQLRGRVDK